MVSLHPDCLSLRDERESRRPRTTGTIRLGSLLKGNGDALAFLRSRDVVMYDAATKEVLQRVFGSDSEDDEKETGYAGISGLTVVKDWLSPSHQVSMY